jgi:hypothetical protein
MRVGGAASKRGNVRSHRASPDFLSRSPRSQTGPGVRLGPVVLRSAPGVLRDQPLVPPRPGRASLLEVMPRRQPGPNGYVSAKTEAKPCFTLTNQAAGASGRSQSAPLGAVGHTGLEIPIGPRSMSCHCRTGSVRGRRLPGNGLPERFLSSSPSLVIALVSLSILPGSASRSNMRSNREICRRTCTRRIET